MPKSQSSFVALYDGPDSSKKTEEYYGFFSSIEQAENMWEKAFKQTDRRLVAICQVVKSYPA